MPDDSLGIYPLTICVDRYGGTYSGGKFTAWNMRAWDVPDSPFADDDSACYFWQDEAHRFAVGVGNTVSEAINNLRENMSTREPYM